MRRRLLLCGVILVLGCCPGPSSAQPSGDMINMFTTVMRQAIVDNVRREWARIPQSQIACLDEALRSQGASVGGIRQQRNLSCRSENFDATQELQRICGWFDVLDAARSARRDAQQFTFRRRWPGLGSRVNWKATIPKLPV